MTITRRPRAGVAAQRTGSAADRDSVLGTAGLVLRAEWRARWPAWLALALVVGLAGGVVLTAAAGAQRTGTAFARLLQGSHAADVSVTVNGNGQAYDQALARLPGVNGLARVLLDELGYVSLVLPSGVRVPSIGADVSADGRWGTSVDRFKVLQGRMFRPGRADEVVIDPQLAAAYHLRPGSTLRLLMVQPGAGDRPTRRASLPFRVVGVVVFSNQIVPVAPSDFFPEIALTPAFDHGRAGEMFPVAGDEALVRLRPGTSVGEFARRASELALRYPQTRGISVTDLADQQVKVEQAIQPQADALALFAALAGLAALVVIAQLLTRQLITGASDYPVLSALGADRRQLSAVALARAGLVSASGGCLAVVIAVAASGLMPIGPARLAEPDPGVQVNVAILGLGLAAVAVLPVLIIAPVAWHVARTGAMAGSEPLEPGTPSWLAGALARLGGVPTAATGARMAFAPGRGRGAVPVRSALTGTVIAIAAVVAALVFGASLVRLVDTPRLYGQDWTLSLSLGFGSVPASGPLGMGTVLSRVPGVTAYAGGNSGQITVDGQQVAAIGIQPLHGGEVFPTLLAGRPPAVADEIALGARTLRQLGKHVGDLVSVQVTPRSRPVLMRVIGEAIFPSFGVGILTPTGLGDGAAVFAPLIPPSSIGCPRGACYGFYLLRFRPGTPRTAVSALGSRFVSAMTAGGCPAGTCQSLTAAAPAAISNYASVRATPLVLGGLLALLAVALLAQVLITTTRRRGRDLAVVKTLGFLRRQVSAAVAWQATALAAVALLVGLPLGVAGGRWAWALFAGSLGVSSGATVPLGAIALMVPVTLLLANAIAAAPGWSAARIKPAVALRRD